MSDQVHCQFKHIPSKRDGEQLASNIETFVQPKIFDKKGIQNCGGNGNDSIPFVLTFNEANKLREKLSVVLPNEKSPIWFHIKGDSLITLNKFSVQTNNDFRHQGSTFNAFCQFGSLRSYNQFYSHVSLKNKIVELIFRPSRSEPDSLNIEFDDIRIVIPFDAIQKKNILINKEKSNGVFILLPLKYVPSIYRLEQVKSDKQTDPNSNKKPIRICDNDRRPDVIRNIENCSDLVIHFEQSQNMAWAFLQNFLGTRHYRCELNFSNFAIDNWELINNKKQRPDPFNYDKASYHDRYCLQMLISLGYVFRDKWAQLTDEQLNWNKWNINERYNLCHFAVEQLSNDHGYDLTRTERDYNEMRKKNQPLKEDTEKLKVALCTLTPLRIIFQPFEITTGSRALRHPELGGAERFLLVHFRDEDNDRLRVTTRDIKERLKNVMLEGIDLLQKKFKYMGASTGQMKEMAFWFVDLPSNIKDIKAAYNKLGRFDDIKNIATYIARVGQYFSRTSPMGIQLIKVKKETDIRPNGPSSYVLEIPDIEKGSYCFTDGIGKISWGLAGRIAQRLKRPLTQKSDIPSAYQIRVAGCKGMVAIDPNSTLNDYYIHVRKSMIKFESDDWNLEICEYARPLTLTLNNQVIRLLSDLGNHDDVFIALQNRCFDQSEIPKEQQINDTDIAIQRNSSYSSSKDHALSNRIPIPPTEGRNMFGVADETGELKYGECFIQYSILDSSNRGQRKYQVVTGNIIVTKNPCLWPGDFRQLKAVRNSKLEECMRDVIVFPTTGNRPHSNEISGSDLDGDQYWVYWGDKFKIQSEVPPLSYEGAKKLEALVIDHERIIDHIVESFSAGVILGMIANTHTVVADQNVKHSFCDECKQLAELFALAVDSPKTGRFIEKDQIRPFQKKYCKGWPQFMKKFGENPLISTSILETLYIRAKRRYEEMGPTGTTNAPPQRQKTANAPPQRKKTAIAIEINDENFKKWLNGDIYEESSNRIPNSDKKPKSDKNDSQTNIERTPSSKPKTSSKDETVQKESEKTTKKTSTAASNRSESSASSNPVADEPTKKETKKPVRKASEDTSNQSEPSTIPKSATGEPPKKETRKVTKKPSEDGSNSSESLTIPMPVADELPKKETKKLARKASEDTSNQSESSTVSKQVTGRNKIKLTNTDNSNTAGAAASSATSLELTNIQQCCPNFLMATDMRITTASVVEFSEVNDGRYIVRLNKEITESPDRDEIINKITSYMEKQDVFSKKPTAYNESKHGTLYLMVFYGHIYFTEKKPFPPKLGELQKLVAAESDQIIQFKYANIEEINLSDTIYSTTKKNKIDYELDCRLSSTSTDFITLLFDKNKTLRQIRVNQLWTKCYVRLPNYNIDNLYEIRSVLIHDSGSSEFDRISDSIFKSQSKDVLTDRKPNIKINHDLLRPSIILISLKIIDEDQTTNINQSEIEGFYRKVKYVSISAEQDKPKVLNTLEYHVNPISKNANILNEVCDFALSPVERPPLDRRLSTASSASTTRNALLGLSSSNEWWH